MSRNGGKAKLGLTELIDEIAKRTDYPKPSIANVIRVWNDIAFECITNDVEFPLGDMGFLTWQKVEPMKHAEWQSWFPHNYGEWIIQDNIPGYTKPAIRLGYTFKKRVKDATQIPYVDEEVGGEK